MANGGLSVFGIAKSYFIRLTALLLIFVIGFPVDLVFAQEQINNSNSAPTTGIIDVQTTDVSPSPEPNPTPLPIPLEVVPGEANADVPVGPEPVDPKPHDGPNVDADLVPDENLEPEDPQLLLDGDENSREIETSAQSLKYAKTDPSSGTLVYSYPITLPPGRKAATPTLSITYNSNLQNNDSSIGYGWSFDIPYIERVNKNGSDKLYDNFDFIFSLTGDLAAVSTSTSATSTFISKVDDGSFLSYQLKNNVWIVYDKAGTRYVFGGAAQSRMDDSNNTDRVYRWMLEEVRDTNDNYIKYEYYKNAGQIYPDEVTYSGHGSTDGIFQVIFNRESQEMSPTMYFPDFSVKTNYRISNIEIRENNQWVRKYDLTTTRSVAHNLLQTITENGRDLDTDTTITKPAVEFKYNQYNATFGVNFSNTTNDQWELPIHIVNRRTGVPSLVQVKDINGDAYPDVIYKQYDNTETCPEDYATWINDTHGGWVQNCSDWIAPAYIQRSGYRYYDNGIRFFDFNGDLINDAVSASTGNSNSTNAMATSTLYKNILNPSSPWTTINDIQVAPFIYDDNYHADNGVEPVDFNGDGITDLIRGWVKDTSGTPLEEESYVGNGAGWTTTNSGWSLPWGLVDANPSGRNVFTYAPLMDLNGDGLVDYVFRHGNSNIGTKVGINNGHDWIYYPSGCWIWLLLLLERNLTS